MTRHDRTRLLELFDPHDARTQAWLTAVRRGLVAWARTVKLKTIKLDRDPAMPRDLHNRVADNWRPLISIADSLGWGAAARDAALAFNREVRDEDAGAYCCATSATFLIDTPRTASRVSLWSRISSASRTVCGRPGAAAGYRKPCWRACCGRSKSSRNQSGLRNGSRPARAAKGITEPNSHRRGDPTVRKTAHRHRAIQTNTCQASPATTNRQTPWQSRSGGPS